MRRQPRRVMLEATKLLACLASYPDPHTVGTGNLPGRWNNAARKLALDQACAPGMAGTHDGWNEWWAEAEARLRERLA